MQPAFKSGDIWITYSWANDYTDMGKALGFDKVEFMDRQAGHAGLDLRVHDGQGHRQPAARAQVRRLVHRPRGVRRLTNLFAYGAPTRRRRKAEITDQTLATKLEIGDPYALDPPVHLEPLDPQPHRLPAGLGGSQGQLDLAH